MYKMQTRLYIFQLFFLHFIIISFIFAENNLTINISYIIKDVTTIKFKNLNI